MNLASARPVLGIVSDRRRLAAAAGVPEVEAPRLVVEQAAAAAERGVDFYQVREPDLETAALLVLVRLVQKATGGRMLVLVNDRADVAWVGGAGVHLRANSFPAERLRRWLPSSTIITRSVHDVDEAANAGPVDGLIAGTTAPTIAKGLGRRTLGAEGLRAVVAASAVPVVAIGGLGPADWPWVSATGARGWAAIGAFLPLPDETVGEAVARVTQTWRGVTSRLEVDGFPNLEASARPRVD